MIAGEHEGVLTDPEVKRQADQASKFARSVIEQNVLALTENRAFLFWFSRWFGPMLTATPPIDGGAKLVGFAAKRELLIQQAQEMDQMSPGFFQRVLEVRDEYERSLRGAAKET